MKHKEFKPLIGSELVKLLTEKGYLPVGTTRCIIDSGQPGELVKIYWAGFAGVDQLRTIFDKLEPM